LPFANARFSTLELSLGNLPEDELGQGYEYLIKKFADDSGHTAAEFYTNRTVVHLCHPSEAGNVRLSHPLIGVTSRAL
jgi:type I restriction-modification system DNA methylase subunit